MVYKQARAFYSLKCFCPLLRGIQNHTTVTDVTATKSLTLEYPGIASSPRYDAAKTYLGVGGSALMQTLDLLRS